MPSQRRITKSRLFLFCLVTGAIIAAISPFAVTWIVNSDFIKTKISDRIFNQTNLKLQAGNYTIQLFPLPAVKIKNLQIDLAEGIQSNIKTLGFTVDLGQLLHKKIGVGKIFISHPEITVNSSQFKKKSASLNIATLKQSFSKMDKTLDFLPENQNTLVVDIEDATSPFFQNMDATIRFHRKKKVELNANITKLHLLQEAFGNLEFDEYLNIEMAAAETIRLSISLSPDQFIRGKCHLTDIHLTAPSDKTLMHIPKSELSFDFSKDSWHLHMPDFALSYPKARAGINFSHDISKKKAEIVFSGSKIDIPEAREMSQNFFKNLAVPQTLFEILIGGVAQKITISFSGSQPARMFLPESLILSGNISEGRVHIPQTRLVTDDITGRVELASGILKINASKGRIESSNLLKGKLEIDLLAYEDEPFAGDFDLDVDLKMLPYTLASLLPGTILAAEMSKTSHISGRCRANLKLDLKTGQEYPKVTVITEPFSAAGTYLPVPGTIKIHSAQIDFTPEKIQINKLDAMINQSEIRNLSCAIGLDSPYLLDVQEGSATVGIAPLIPWLSRYQETRKRISPLVWGSGEIQIKTIMLEGPVLVPEKWRFKASGTMNNLMLSSEMKKAQIDRLSGTYDISHQQVSFTNLSALVLALPPFALLKDDIYLSSLKTPFQINEGYLKKESDTSAHFKCSAVFNKQQRLRIDLRGKDIKSLEPHFFELIDPGMSDAHFAFEYADTGLKFDFNGSLETQSLHKLIKEKSPLADRLNALTEGQPVSVHTDEKNVLNLFVPALNLNSLNLDKDLFSGKQLLSDNLINFKAGKLTYKALRLKNLDTKIMFKPDHSYIRLKKADLCGLKIQGYLNLINGKVFADFPIAATNKESVEPLLACLIKKKGFMDGAYSMKGNLTAAAIPLKAVPEKCNGFFEFNAQDGRIYHLTLLSRILSILNVSKVLKGKIPDVTQKGFAYQNIHIEADIRESIVHLNQAVIDGQDMTMIFSGTIDPVNDKLNLTCLVAPFKTVDLLIEKIPIINTLLNNRLISVPVKATGKLSDPTVIPLHPSAVGKGLVDIMSNIVKSPITLWDKIARDDQDK